MKKDKKTPEQFLDAFKHANKVYKLQLARRAGYDTAEEYKKKLEKKVAKVKGRVTLTVTLEPKPKQPTDAVDYVIAFDTTGSMATYIRAVRTKVEELTNDLFSNSSNLKMKIVAFGDYCDFRGYNDPGNAYQFTDLTSNVAVLINFIHNAESTSGGDTAEFYEYVLKRIIDETDWRSNSKKVILLIADFMPHELGYSCLPAIKNNQIDWRVQAYIAQGAGIQVDTLTIRNDQPWYQELSDITGGVCMPFKSVEKINEAILGSTYARTNAFKFMERKAAAEASGDKELTATYTTLSKKLIP